MTPRTRTRENARCRQTIQPPDSRNTLRRRTLHLTPENWKILAKGYRGRLCELPTIIHTITKLDYIDSDGDL
jgi:hypothetical protein